VIDPNTNRATYYVAVVDNSKDDSQQNYPKKQRTGNEGDLNSGGSNGNVNPSGNDNRGEHTQSSQQRNAQGGTEKGKEVVVSSTSLSDDVSDSFATRIRKIMGPQDASVEDKYWIFFC
jgi:hypothetical protein